MSTFQLSFKTTLGFVSIIERDGYITNINFRKIIKQKKLRSGPMLIYLIVSPLITSVQSLTL